MPNLNWITKKHFSNLSPQQINLGNCYNWALVAYQNYNNVKLYSTDNHGGHAFVKIGQKYFDAESPLGELHWANLNFFRWINNPVVPRRESLRSFLAYWGKEGKNPIIYVGENVCNWNNR